MRPTVRYPQLQKETPGKFEWGDLIRALNTNDIAVADELQTINSLISDASSALVSAEQELMVVKQTWATDYLVNNNTQGQFLGTAVAGGAVTYTGTNINFSNHPGTARVSSAAATSSGFLVRTHNNAILVTVGYECNNVFNHDSIDDNEFRFGFFDSSDSTQPVDACMFVVSNGGQCVGKNISNSTVTVTPVMLSVALSTWYRYRVYVDNGFTTYRIYDDSSTVLASVNLAGSVPTGTSRWTGAGFIALTNSATAKALGIVDYTDIRINTSLVRGGV